MTTLLLACVLAQPCPGCDGVGFSRTGPLLRLDIGRSHERYGFPRAPRYYYAQPTYAAPRYDFAAPRYDYGAPRYDFAPPQRRDSLRFEFERRDGGLSDRFRFERSGGGCGPYGCWR